MNAGKVKGPARTIPKSKQYETNVDIKKQLHDNFRVGWDSLARFERQTIRKEHGTEDTSQGQDRRTKVTESPPTTKRLVRRSNECSHIGKNIKQ